MGFMLNGDDGDKLLAAGYTLWEVQEFSEARTPEGVDQPAIDLTKKPWIEALSSRRKWRDSLLSAGWTYEQFEKAVYDQYNRDTKQSPWDFLKSEYKAPGKPNFKTTIEATQRVRNFKSSVRRELRTDRRKVEQGIKNVSRNKEDQEFFSGSLGDTIRRLNREGR